MQENHFKETLNFIKSLYPGKDFIPLHEPYFGGNEKKYLNECIDSTFVSSVGKFVDRFENDMTSYTGAKYAVAIVNGTCALQTALLLAGVKPGELVITQPLSFIATCNAIKYLGAEPLFTDVDTDTLGLSPQKLRDFLQNKTYFNKTKNKLIHKSSGRIISACVPMHTFGFPAGIDEIIEICDEFGIPVVEDAAESIGSFYKEKHTGTFGLAGTFSFNGNKTITSGGGGILTTNNEELAKRAKHITTQAKIPHRWEYAHDEIGYNYRCPNLNAALAVAQLEQLDNMIKNKRQTAKKYSEFFENAKVKFISEPKDSKANCWLNCIMLKDKNERDEFLKYTNDNGVMTRPAWTLLNKLKMFKDCIYENIDNSELIEGRLVSIPSSVRI